MPKSYYISENQITELEKAQKKNKDKNIDRRLEALLLRAEGKKRNEIAKKTGFSVPYISKLVSKYCKNGITAITEKKHTGNHRNLSFEQEEALIKPFEDAASEGHIVCLNEIKQAYEQAIGSSLENNHGQIYRVLKRHGWRKVMPRSKHPNKASDEEIEASKKLTFDWVK